MLEPRSIVERIKSHLHYIWKQKYINDTCGGLVGLLIIWKVFVLLKNKNAIVSFLRFTLK